MMNITSFENIINQAWESKSQINSKSNKKLLNAISKTIDLLDSGKIRVAEKKTMNGLLISGLKKQFY